MSIVEASRLMREGKTSAEKLTAAAIEAIQRHQPRLNAFITVTAGQAMEQARLLDAEMSAGRLRGPLHGIPVAVKDVFCTRGLLTTAGSKLFADHVPDHDAAAVERLRQAGAVIVGKTNQHELAYGITSSNPHYGPVRNPWNTGCVPGGSSGGSGAAVAARMCFMAMGNDTGGSIRIPASFCGVVGLKPTIGRVSRYGVMPLDFTLDHVGPITRSVRDAALCLNVLAGYDPRDDSSSTVPAEDYTTPDPAAIDGWKVGVPENFFFDDIDPEVAEAVRDLAEQARELGATLVRCRVPDIAAINAVGRMILLPEASAAMTPFLARRADLGADVLALLDQGRMVTAADYINAQRLRRQYQEEFARLWKQVDVLLTPATPIPAPLIGQTEVSIGGRSEDVRLASTRLARAINVLGVPALSVPCGVTAGGLPVGAQIIGPPFAEKRILHFAAALEQAGVTAAGAPPGL